MLSLPSRYGSSSIYCCKASQAFIHNRASPNGRLQGRHKDSSAEINYKKWPGEKKQLNCIWDGRAGKDRIIPRSMWQDSEVLLLWLKDRELTIQVYTRAVLSKSRCWGMQKTGVLCIQGKQLENLHWKRSKRIKPILPYFNLFFDMIMLTQCFCVQSFHPSQP